MTITSHRCDVVIGWMTGMPSRVIREGILTSERVAQLDAEAELFYRRLLNKVDDHGLFDARAAVLRAALFPLKLDQVREADCSRWLAACESAGLLVLYSVPANAGRSAQDSLRAANAPPSPQDRMQKTYLKVLDTRWPIRSEPKYPTPPTR